MRRLLNFILSFSLIFGFASYSFAHNFDATRLNDEIIYRTSTYKVNSIDPGINSDIVNSFPGYRGANQLVIYTSEYGQKTGTNEFGTEAIVVNGYVTSISGADSLIPANGFVISGHGKAKEWINKNVTLGSKIVVNPNMMTITSALTPESFLFEANEKVKEVFSIMKYYSYQNILYDYSHALEYLEKSQKALSLAASQKEISRKHSISAIENVDLAIEYSIPYYENELKGVWIRPVEKDKSEIEKTLDKLKDAGINNIFLETYYHAKTIYPSNVLEKYGVTNQRQEFVGFDPLMTWITEAHKRGMKLNVWFECFYVGNDNPNINPKHILNVYPQWANTTKDKFTQKGPVASMTEHNGYFLDPANPQVQDFLLDVLNEIVTKYEPDGVNLDYIRYPQTVEKKSSLYEGENWGYTQFARSEFISMYKVDPIEIKKNSSLWETWARYRQDKVSDFVRHAGILVREKGNGAKITAVIFPDRQRSLDTKMQDWKTWSQRNYIDGFTPLLLSCDYATARSLLLDIKNNSIPKTDIYAGIFVSFMNGTTDDMLRQIHMARQLKTKGVIVFEYSHFTKKYIDALSKSAFNPLSEKSLKKIKSGEISQRKLQNYLDKEVSDFYHEEMKINKDISEKQQKIIDANYTKNKKAEKQPKKKNDAVFSENEKQGKNGRFY